MQLRVRMPPPKCRSGAFIRVLKAVRPRGPLTRWQTLRLKQRAIADGIGDGRIPNAGALNNVVVVRVAQILFSVAVICGAAFAYAHPSGLFRTFDEHWDGAAGAQVRSEKVVSTGELENRALPEDGLPAHGFAAHRQQHAALFPEPSTLHAIDAMPYEGSEFSARWTELLSRIRLETETLVACRSGVGSCPAGARRFLSIIELGLNRQGRAKLGEINRAVNLSIKPASDGVLYGVEDFWSAPLSTLSIGAGDCEDYAIVKYVALRESGIAPDDLQLVIVRDVKRKTNHAVVAVRHEDEWLILDNRTLIMANAEEASQYSPLLVLDHRGVRTSESAALHHRATLTASVNGRRVVK